MYSKCSLVIIFLDLCDVTQIYITNIICGARKSYEQLLLYPEGVLLELSEWDFATAHTANAAWSQYGKCLTTE
jgi:hypothetical protein